jgi:hypothetical protein
MRQKYQDTACCIAVDDVVSKLVLRSNGSFSARKATIYLTTTRHFHHFVVTVRDGHRFSDPRVIWPYLVIPTPCTLVRSTLQASAMAGSCCSVMGRGRTHKWTIGALGFRYEISPFKYLLAFICKSTAV